MKIKEPTTRYYAIAATTLYLWHAPLADGLVLLALLGIAYLYAVNASVFPNPKIGEE